MRILARLLGYTRAHWPIFSAILVVMTTEASLRLAPAWLTKTIVDDVALTGTFGQLGWLVLGLFLVTGIARALNSLQNYLTEWMGQNVVHDLRNDLYRHLQGQSMSFFDSHQTGQLMSRVTSDVSQVQFFVANGTIRILDAFIGITLYVVVLLVLDVQLALVALTAAPVIFFVQLRMRRITRIYRELQRMMAQLTGILQENVTAIKLVKAYARERYETDRFLSQYWQIRTKRLDTTRLMNAWSQSQEISTALAAVSVLYFGAQRVMEGTLTVGGLVAFQTYVGLLWGPIRMFGFINQAVQQALASGERVFEIIDWPLDVAEKPGALPLGRVHGALAFENVSFSYGQSIQPTPQASSARQSSPIQAGGPAESPRQAQAAQSRALLSDVTLDVPPGTSLAIVGPSGSGKTTLVNLIPRFYDATAGRVTVDGVDVRDVTLQSLRSQVGMVLQETFLFNMTIKENIRYGREDATDAEVEAAADAANAHGFIMELPDGYDTLTGEKGVRLSGGQRQRLAIARALLVDPRILILDEATSSVDTRTDYLIQRALERLMRGRTTVIVAHRLSTILRADQIVYLDAGRVLARGRHADLLESCAPYRWLYETQFQIQEREGEEAEVAEPVAAR